MNHFQKHLIFAALLLALAVHQPGAKAAERTPPKLQEVLDLIRSNLGGMKPAEIESATLKALLKHFEGRVILEEKPVTTAPPTAGPGLSKSARFDEKYGYLRINHVTSGLGDALAVEFNKLGGTAKLKGLILDLRYAGGTDQKAAALTADRFLASERALLTVGGEAIRSTAKTNAIQLPTAILVNRQTSGAAEVLAALLRQNQIGLLIGTATTGGVRQYKDFTLSTGQRLRIATGETKLGDGQAMPVSGLRPDIAISVTPGDERAFYAEPFGAAKSSSGAISANNANAGPARINEAELLRRQQAGEDPDAATPPPAPTLRRPAIADPAIARSLDLLKGLNLVLPQRKP